MAKITRRTILTPRESSGPPEACEFLVTPAGVLTMTVRAPGAVVDVSLDPYEAIQYGLALIGAAEEARHRREAFNASPLPLPTSR